MAPPTHSPGQEEHEIPVARRSWVDPDVDTGGTVSPARPLHLRGRYLYVVFVGGMLGTIARWATGQLVADPAGWPVATLVVNLLGALALGWLLEGLLRTGPDRGWPRLARLHFGTGFCGAFTTYSALATETVLLVDGHRAVTALSYLTVSLVGGCLAAWAGVRLAVATTGRSRSTAVAGSGGEVAR